MITAAYRLATAALLLLLIFAATRATIRALPGDPLETLIAESGTAIAREELRTDLGLDRPFLASLFEDLRKATHGNLGRSLLSSQPVAPLVVRRLLRTLALAATSLLIGIPISLWLGLAAASRPGGWTDRLCTLYGGLTAALPTPWLGPMLLIALAVWLPIFPVGGHVVLPALTLAIHFSGFWSRLIRDRVRETLLRGAAPGARARGLAEWKVVAKYGFAPASAALAGFFGSYLGGLIAGAFVTEMIFDWKGLGMLLVQSVLKRDYPMIEGATFVTAAACLLGTLAGDWMQDRLQPEKAGDSTGDSA